MQSLVPSPEWLARLRARTQAPPLQARFPLLHRGRAFGSAEARVLQALHLPGLLQRHGDVWTVQGELTEALARIAQVLQAGGWVRAWRDEQIDVCDDHGTVLGTVERGVVRLLGICTHAVHLLATAPDGRHWVQQRALDKPTDPGLWDTLVGGMIGAGESVQLALERETWEEAGLRLPQLAQLRDAGHLLVRRPSSELPGGYVIERLSWFSAVLPAGVVPENQDGEVAQFRCMGDAEVRALFAADAFTSDAALLMTATA